MPLLNEAVKNQKARVTAAVLGENPEKGTPFVGLDLDTEKGSIRHWLYLSDAAFDRTVRTLREAFDFDNNFETLPAQVTGKDCQITTEFETYQGKERLKVKWLNPLNAVKPISEANALSEFSKRAARVADEAPKAGATAPKAEPAPAASTVKKPDPF